MTTQMLTKYLNRGRISYLMAYALSAKKQQYSLISINSHDTRGCFMMSDLSSRLPLQLLQLHCIKSNRFV